MQLVRQRNTYDKERDRDSIRILVLKGKSPEQIAAELGLAPQQVKQDIEVIKRRLTLRAFDDDIEKFKAKQLEELALIKKELWESWQESKKLQKKTTTNSTSNRGTRTEEIEEEGPGDVKYVESILKCINEENRLRGAIASNGVKAKIDISVNNTDQISARDEILQLIDDAAHRSRKNEKIIETLKTGDSYVPLLVENNEVSVDNNESKS